MKKRVISAIIALAIVIPLIVLGGTWFYLGIGVIGLIGFYELMTIRESKKKFPLVTKILAVISFAMIMLSSINNTHEFIIDYRIAVLPFLLLIIPIVPYLNKDKYDIADALYLIGSVFFLGIAFNFLVTLRNMDLYLFIYLILITIMSDTFAHFFGTQVGKYKLCPKVSPNKTIEGFIGGTVAATFIGTMFFTAVFDFNGSILLIILISLLLSVVGAIGDLVFSSIKRHYGVKDFGNIMPGHGGVLDRLDSVIFAGLALALVVSFL